MIITDLYQTKITVYSDSNYSTVSNNINIDGTAYIKVKLIDFNGAAVSGKSVTIKYDESTVVATGTTNSNGEFTASYTCTEWGIHSFSANNHNTLQILVKGYKDWYNYNNLILQANKLTGMSKLSLNRTLTINANSRITLKEAYTQGSDNEVICPTTTLKVPTHQNNIWIQIDYLGKIVAINTSNSTVSNINVQCYTSWSFKNNNY